jgi:hypothetical protein
MEPQRWSTRWSPAEMMYLEVRDNEVVMYLDHSPQRPDRFTFEQVLSGEAEKWYRNEFGENVAREVAAAVRKRMAQG